MQLQASHYGVDEVSFSSSQSEFGVNILFSHYVCDSFLSRSLCSDNSEAKNV